MTKHRRTFVALRTFEITLASQALRSLTQYPSEVVNLVLGILFPYTRPSKRAPSHFLYTIDSVIYPVEDDIGNYDYAVVPRCTGDIYLNVVASRPSRRWDFPHPLIKYWGHRVVVVNR